MSDMYHQKKIEEYIYWRGFFNALHGLAVVYVGIGLWNHDRSLVTYSIIFGALFVGGGFLLEQDIERYRSDWRSKLQ